MCSCEKEWGNSLCTDVEKSPRYTIKWKQKKHKKKTKTGAEPCVQYTNFGIFLNEKNKNWYFCVLVCVLRNSERTHKKLVKIMLFIGGNGRMKQKVMRVNTYVRSPHTGNYSMYFTWRNTLNPHNNPTPLFLFFQMKKLRLREGKELAWGHTASKQQG